MEVLRLTMNLAEKWMGTNTNTSNEGSSEEVAEAPQASGSGSSEELAEAPQASGLTKKLLARRSRAVGGLRGI